MRTTPNEIKEAKSAAIAKAVPALSVSTTVRTPAAVAMVDFAPAVAEVLGAAATAGVEEAPGFAAGETPGMGGLVAAGNATVAVGAPAGLAAAVAGLGGREIRMVSLRKSAGGFAVLGTATTAEPPPGTGGTEEGATGAPGIEGAWGLGKGGAPDTTGFGGGANLMVSFFRPGDGGAGAGLPGGRISGAPGILGGLGTDGAPGGLGGGGGGTGIPLAIVK